MTDINLKDRIYFILIREETEDKVPPFRVLPTGCEMWYRIKAESIKELVNKQINAIRKEENENSIKN